QPPPRPLPHPRERRPLALGRRGPGRPHRPGNRVAPGPADLALYLPACPPSAGVPASGGEVPLEQRGRSRMTRFSVEFAHEPDSGVRRTDGYTNSLGAERMGREYDRLFGDGCRNFIINFAKSPIINSVGLAILLGIIEKTLSSDGRMVFCCLTEVNAETMEIMDIAQYVPLAATEEGARGILRQGACVPT